MNKLDKYSKETSRCSSVSSERDLVSSLPALLVRGSEVGLSVTSNSETSVLLADGGETSVLSVIMFAADDPIDSSVSSDGLVEWVDEDNFVEFVSSILTNPVRVEDSEVLASSSDSVFSDGSVGSVGLELVDTLVDGLSIDDTLADGLLSSTSSNSDSVDDIALLSLVAELSGFVGS